MNSFKLALILLTVASASFADEEDRDVVLQKRVEELEQKVQMLMDSKLIQDDCPCDLNPLSKAS